MEPLIFKRLENFNFQTFPYKTSQDLQKSQNQCLKTPSLINKPYNPTTSKHFSLPKIDLPVDSWRFCSKSFKTSTSMSNMCCWTSIFEARWLRFLGSFPLVEPFCEAVFCSNSDGTSQSGHRKPEEERALNCGKLQVVLASGRESRDKMDTD